jgi:hypothetical protein
VFGFQGRADSIPPSYIKRGLVDEEIQKSLSAVSLKAERWKTLAMEFNTGRRQSHFQFRSQQRQETVGIEWFSGDAGDRLHAHLYQRLPQESHRIYLRVAAPGLNSRIHLTVPQAVFTLCLNIRINVFH